ncbi:MAG: hypothetical protein WB609_14250 [Candidatus Cybelea sp.]
MDAILKTLFASALAVASALSLQAPAAAGDAGRIDAYVTPYYDSSRPVIRIGKYSSGLASANEATFVATISQMKKDWNRLSFMQLYVGAIRLYDLGYRWEATYWFYSAQYCGRQFGLLVNQKAIGSIGDPGFELYHAQDAFLQLAGPDINGYAFGDIDSLVKVIQRVQSANRNVPDLESIYPHVDFISKTDWRKRNAELNGGLGTLATSLESQKAQIARERAQNGTAARFSHLTSKQFPGGY